MKYILGPEPLPDSAPVWIVIGLMVIALLALALGSMP